MRKEATCASSATKKTQVYCFVITTRRPSGQEKKGGKRRKNLSPFPHGRKRLGLTEVETIPSFEEFRMLRLSNFDFERFRLSRVERKDPPPR